MALPEQGSIEQAFARLRRAAAAYDAKMVEYNAPGYGGLRMGFGAIQHELIEAARELAFAAIRLGCE